MNSKSIGYWYVTKRSKPTLFKQIKSKAVVLCIVTEQGGGRCSTIDMVKIALHSAKGCCFN